MLEFVIAVLLFGGTVAAEPAPAEAWHPPLYGTRGYLSLQAGAYTVDEVREAAALFWPPDELDNAVCAAWYESSNRWWVINWDDPGGSYSIWQVNKYYHPSYDVVYGRTREALVYNAYYAYTVWRDHPGWGAWYAWRDYCRPLGL